MLLRLTIPIPLLLVPAFASEASEGGLFPPAPSELRIEGPERAITGEIVVLEAAGGEAGPFAWGVTPGLDGGRRTLLPFDEGRRCVLASVPGRYVVFLAAGGAERVRLTQRTVLVQNDDGSEPGPNPPGPVPPDGRFEIAVSISDWLREVADPRRGERAAALAEAFAGLAEEVEAGRLKENAQIAGAISRAGSAIIPEAERDAWAAFNERFGQALRRVVADGKVRSADDWAELLREIAAAFRTG